MSSSFQASILVAAPSYPNSVAWSEENLVAVASGHIVAILNPAKPFGSRGLITIPHSKPFPIGLIDRKDLLSGCMLHIALSRDSSPQEKQYRENRPCVRSISWSPIGFAPNSGCLLAVCTTEGHVRLYRMPFREFSAEWVEVMDISKELYSYLTTTNFQAASFRASEASDPSQACFDEGYADDLPISVMRKELKRQRLNALTVMEVKACSQKGKNTFNAPRSKAKSSKIVVEDGSQSLITAEEYASRSAMMSSLIVAWSPCLPQTFGCGISTTTGLTSDCSVLAVGGKSGILSLWRIHKPDEYSIMNKPDLNEPLLVGLLNAHDTWITTISWGLFISDASDPLLLLATGCSDGSVKIWQACCRRLVESSELSDSPFSLLKEVKAVDFAMASVVSFNVSAQSPNKMLLAIGNGSGSIEVWSCDILVRRFEKAGSCDAHNHVVTGLAWAFGGRCLYSCSQDNSTCCWILHENSLCEVPIPSNTPGVKGSGDVPDAFSSCFGLAVSPGNLVMAVVRAFATEQLNQMYEARALKAAVEFLWIGGQQLDNSSTVYPDFDVKVFPDFPEKELISWENNILWSLNQHEPLDKPLVVWDVVAALLAFKQSISIFVKRIIIKWLKSSVGSQFGVSANLSEAIKCLSEFSSRKLQLLNIISKLVVLKKVETDKVEGQSQFLEGFNDAEDERLDWTQLHSNSEMELRDRLVGYSFTVFLDDASGSDGKGSKSSYWVQFQIAHLVTTYNVLLKTLTSKIPKMTSWSATVAPPLSPPSSDSDSDSDSATTSDSHHHRHSDLSSTIFKSYLEHSSGDHNNQQQQQHDLIKIQSFLTSSRSGALSCLICLERIRPSDPTWSCSSGCFAVFYLHCIQSWAVQCSNLAAARAVTRAATPNDSSLLWHCPKCRVEYSKSQIPKNYYCFCGKLPDPPHDPWVLPHSCNEICGRPLKYNCGHHCLLLCHPGPCPSCPKLVKSRCFCGAVEDVKRCGFKNFSCNGVCKKLLDCKTHMCTETCHEGDCPPCKAKGIYKCQCGKLEMKRECFDRVFRCENPCDKLLGCGRHKCERGCHEGECGDCPLQGKRTCPCGKRVYEGIACDAPVSVCGATCGKMLSCGFHRCPERCHKGPCIETCRVVVTKSCRCGSYRKQVPCYQDLTCERKCQKMRDCGRHACKRKCCDGDCPPCSEMCDRKLRCRNHKCPAPCHRGACAPCPVMVTISCLCGETHFEVPCGAEAEQKPPKCRKPCCVDRLCRHASNCKPHRCHYGACPPCRLLCDEEYPCGHKCELRCHGPTQPPLPEFTLKPKKRRPNNQTEPTPGSSCPPCPQLVWRSCLGNHVGAERMMVCSDRTVFSCDNLCGNPLPCGNHYCTKVCHALVSSTKLYGSRRPESCEECTLPCQQERKPTCPHPCPLRCHPGECPPCKALIKRSCHCGSMVHVFECIYYNSLSAKEQLTVRSCGGPCHRKLPNCTHLCPETCHPGECPSPDQCSKKVTARCGCQTLKKELVCKDVQAAYRSNGTDPKDVSRNQYGLGILPCNSDCRSKVKAAEGELQHRKLKAPEEKEPETKDNVTKRRRRKGRVLEDKKTSILQRIIAGIRRFLLFVIIIIALIASVYLGYKGLLWLSDWMNEAEIKRQRRYSRT